LHLPDRYLASKFIVLVVDGASSHFLKEINIPENIRLLRLTPYAPQLSPLEHNRGELREKEFPRRVFADLPSVTRQLQSGLTHLASTQPALAASPSSLGSLVLAWIGISIIEQYWG
jgi:hypothetical protein